MLKFASDGTHVLTVGEPGPAGVEVPDSNDTNGGLNGTHALQSGGYRGRSRRPTSPTSPMATAITGWWWSNAENGQYKRHWARTAKIRSTTSPPTPSGSTPNLEAGIIPHFRNPVHCVRVTEDRKVYVCDRVNNRPTGGGGRPTVPSSRRSSSGRYPEPRLGMGPRHLGRSAPDCPYNADGTNQEVDTLTGQAQRFASFGTSGRYAGQFHGCTTWRDRPEGSIYTAEVDTGKRARSSSAPATAGPSLLILRAAITANPQGLKRHDPVTGGR